MLVRTQVAPAVRQVLNTSAAPEILKGGAYTDKVDMWSVGVITYIL